MPGYNPRLRHRFPAAWSPTQVPTVPTECIPDHPLGLAGGLLGLWNPANPIDLTGRGNNGSLTGGPLIAPGRFGPTLNLNGSSQWVTIQPQANTTVNNTAISFGGWVFPTGTADYQMIIGRDVNAGNRYWAMYLVQANTSGLYVALNNGATPGSAGAIYSLSTPWQVNAWNHFAVVYNGAVGVIYLNGYPVYSSSWPGAITDSLAYPIHLGAEGSDNKFHVAGAIGPCFLYNTALTARQVAWLAAEPFTMLRPTIRRSFHGPFNTPIYMTMRGGIALAGRSSSLAAVGMGARSSVAGAGREAPAAALATTARGSVAAAGHATPSLPLATHATAATATQGHAPTAAPASIAARSTVAAAGHLRPATALNLAARTAATVTARQPAVSRIAVAARATAAVTGRAAIGTTINVIAITGRLGAALGGFVRLVLRLPPPPAPTPQRTSVAGSVNRATAAPFVDRGATARRVNRSTYSGEP
jgi:hypothetical protein